MRSSPASDPVWEAAALAPGSHAQALLFETYLQLNNQEEAEKAAQILLQEGTDSLLMQDVQARLKRIQAEGIPHAATSDALFPSLDTREP